jgi:hypothetical protein
MKLIPHERWGEKFIGTLKGPFNNPKTLGPKISQKHA